MSLNGGANKCKLWRAFAARGMGSGASSPSDKSTTSIATSTALPSECAPIVRPRALTPQDVLVSIPHK